MAFLARMFEGDKLRPLEHDFDVSTWVMPLVLMPATFEVAWKLTRRAESGVVAA